ncbi:protein kinase domain-containing protein [Nannocystaceae bacterium ST9]
MTCPEPAQLESLFQGTLAADERARLERHLDVCEDCAGIVAELARLFASASWGVSLVRGEPVHDETAPGLGRYQLLRRLGAGAMGVVFEAYDPELERRVAIKLLHVAADPGAVEHTQARLLREARAMARLAHPHVVAVHDVGRLGDRLFVAMELVEGPTLRGWLADSNRSRAEILAAFVGAGRGLAAAHGEGLVHRDFKPDNVLIGRDGRARVTDFGLAFAGHAAPRPGAVPDLTRTTALTSTQAQSSQATAAGSIVGTPAYMAPEQWLGAPADARSDQFGFCVALHEALFGRRPFAGDRLEVLQANVLAGRREGVPRSAPGWLRAALDRGLAGDPGRRHRDMGALLGELERDRGGRQRVAIGVASLVIGALGSAAIVANLPRDRDVGSELVPTEVEVRANDPAATCLVELEGAGGRWTSTRREALVAQLGEATDEARARAIVGRLDAWVEAWRLAAAPRCEGPREGEAPAIDRCLDQAALSLDALVGAALDADPFQLSNSAVAIAWSLPRIDDCVAGLVAPPALPSAAERVEVDALDRELASVEALVILERVQPAREAADATSKRAERLAHAPTLARARLAQARVAMLEGLPAQALPWFEAAGEAAGGGVHPAVERDAALASMTERGARWLDRAEAARWRRIVLGLLARGEAGDPGERALLAGRLALADAWVSMAEGEYVHAREQLGEAEQAFAAELDHADPWALERGLAQVQLELALGDVEAALEAGTKLEELAGAHHGGSLLHAAASLALAEARLAAGELAGAAQLADSAIRIPVPGRSRRHDHWRGVALGLSGRIAAARGDEGEAESQFERAEVFLFDGPERAWPWLWRAELALGRRRIPAGRDAIEAGLAYLGELGPDDARRLPMLELAGRALLEAGELERARVMLDAAFELVDRRLGSCPRRAFVQRDLGELEQRAGRSAQALEHFDAAHVMLAGGLGLRHGVVVRASLARADLAWALGERDYAEGLYGVIDDELEALGELEAAARAKQRAAR